MIESGTTPAYILIARELTIHRSQLLSDLSICKSRAGGSEGFRQRCKKATRSPHSDVTTKMFEEKLCIRLEHARGEKVPPECETMMMIGSFKLSIDFFV